MKELICPNCGKPFQVDDADYAKLLGQVKNDEFQAELNTRIEELHAQWESEHRYYRPYNADWPEDYETRFSPEFPGELIAPYWHRLQNARTFFHQQTLPLRAVAPEDAIRQLDRTEALFDTLFVRTVSQQYYLRLYVDAYEELMPREIDKCFLSLNN